MTESSKLILLDTNVLLRLAEVGHPQHMAAAAALRRIRVAEDVPVVVPQVLYEFWVVATRPREANGLGMPPPDAAFRISRITGFTAFVDDPPELFGKWLSLVEDHNVRGKPAHDARLAAAALVHSIDGILTFNDRDFARFGVAVQTP